MSLSKDIETLEENFERLSADYEELSEEKEDLEEVVSDLRGMLDLGPYVGAGSILDAVDDLLNKASVLRSDQDRKSYEDGVLASIEALKTLVEPTATSEPEAENSREYFAGKNTSAHWYVYWTIDDEDRVSVKFNYEPQACPSVLYTALDLRRMADDPGHPVRRLSESELTH